MISSDGSFTAPRISEPRLVRQRQVFRRPRRRPPLGVGVPGWRHGAAGRGRLRGAGRFRDPAAEARVLGRCRRSRSPGNAARLRSGPRTLHGLDTMAFSTEVLPLLSGRDDVRVEVSGRVPDYREAGDSLRIGVSAGRARRRAGLVRPRHHRHRRGPRGPVRRAVRGAGQRPVAPAARRRRLLLARQAGADRARPADRGGPRADGPACRRTARCGSAGSRPACGRSWPASAWSATRPRRGSARCSGLLSRRRDRAPCRCLRRSTRCCARTSCAGFQWLAFLWRHGLGGILADDMGLGKTLQTLALLRTRKTCGPRSQARTVRIILSSSSRRPRVLANWAAEARRFTPDLKVVTISDTLGPARRARSQT